MIKKIIEPVIITIIIICIMFLYFGICMIVPIPDIIKIIIGIIIFALIGVSIYVLVERIKEIRRRENDDLSKY